MATLGRIISIAMAQTRTGVREIFIGGMAVISNGKGSPEAEELEGQNLST